MKQVFSTSKGIEVIEVPAPALLSGHVLVEVEYSFISSGTEMATVEALESSTPSHSEVVASSASMAKITRYLRENGVKKTVSRVFNRLTIAPTGSPRLAAIGYSCSGRVVGVGEGVTLFNMGDRVACAGASKATHSELVVVPENLTLMVPDGCDMKDASSVAVGSIAMQGVRRANVQLGEFVAVIGLGLVGSIIVQMLKLAGTRVIGFDLDPARVDHIKGLGIQDAYADPEELQRLVNRITRHMGVDCCMIAAGSRNSDIVQTAMEVTRPQGRVVAVGIVGMDLQRNPLYRKEIDFLISRSYGPGRYDDTYEEKGMDYPYGYVRWTEKRNMEEYLRLLAEQRLDISTAADEYPLGSATLAFESLKDPVNRPVAAFIRYSDEKNLDDKRVSRVDIEPRPRSSDRVRIAVAGAGAFVKGVHLPSIARLAEDVALGAILNRSGAKSMELARQFGAGYATTSYDELLKDPDIDAVLIGTRHNTHGSMTIQAIRAGKHVLVEKPLALTEEELAEIEAFYTDEPRDGRHPVLLTGFNRRFAPLISEMKSLADRAGQPIIMNYQMNVGYVAPDHWQRTEEGGGRNLGEACHIYDLFTYLTDSRVANISAHPVKRLDDTYGRNENFAATISFADGSVATLIYTSLGSTLYPKETFHMYANETVAVLSDYEQLEIYGASSRVIPGDRTQKGHFEEMKAFVDSVKNGSDWPSPLWHQLQASRIALEVERQIMGHD